MQVTVRKTNEDLSAKRAAAGRRGGLAVLEKYGVDHMKKIGAKGAEVFHSRYEYKPVGQDDFAVVHRETNVIVALLSGLPF